MRKAKIFLEVEVEINKDDPNDKGMDYSEIADIACNGITYSIKSVIAKNKRPTKLVNSMYEFTITKQCF